MRSRDYDARTHEIEQHGFAVIRFGNEDMRDRLDDVLTPIRQALDR